VTACIAPDGTVTDPLGIPTAHAVLEAVLATYDATEVQGPCAAGLASGAMAAVDRGIDTADGCCGQLWVRVADAYPSRRFPEPDAFPAPAEDLAWAVMVEVGIVRPATMVREIDGKPVLPSMQEETDAAERTLIDAAMLRQALLVTYAEEADVTVLLGRWVPLGPEGGVVGGAYTATIQVL
jgi:hypothetical protein